ncbi:aminotransferase class V-fold PLP-dependent enzyme [Dactylosporangium fulvum]|uniref:Aminotransferase class V-fold PLP-dependent enzyme n=1 Tax=Dactylosporangium fulvum TaxID=53359 RepID=A0ABY5W449_9ACTN|nr:aminotransferase class V-fold PLP-dependent enzyme [Dactylosporangium fulvum]UWP84140.1 aminotransferase class V-fold PLP-dependent enzyme [Dactylosporangium fulvum]
MNKPIPAPDAPQPIPGARLLFSNDASVAQLNHGSFGMVPIAVQRAQQRLRDEMEANPHRFFSVGLEERITHVRRHLATFVGADPDGSALVNNASTGTSIVLSSLGLAADDEIVTTDHGYGAVDLAVDEICRRTGAVHRVAPVPLVADDATVTAAVLAAITPRTRLVIVDLITAATAQVFPVRRIIEAVRAAHGERVAIHIDAAHGPGLLDEPVRELDADFWVGNLHKWAYAPRGTALLAVAPAWRARIRPLVLSWSTEAGFPASLEWLGAHDYTPWLAAPTGLFVLRSLGLETVRRHNTALAEHGRRLVADALGVEVLPATGLPMTLVPLPPGVAADLTSAVALRRRISDELSAEVGLAAWHGRGYLRLSAQVYNRVDDFQRLADGLPKLIR